jgi:hypothetical protein
MTSFVREPLPIPSDETVRWTGEPPSGLLWRSTDWILVPFSLMWGGFALFWESMVISAGAPLVMKLWGVPFVCVGLYLIVGRFFWDANLRARTRYAVTDRAAYIVVTGFRGVVRRYSGSGLDDVGIERKDDGSGTIRFGPDPRTTRQGPRSASFVPQNAFESIRDVDHAYDAVRAAAGGAASG